MPVLAVDMGGTSIKAGIVENGEVLDASQIPASAHTSLEENLKAVNECLQNLMQNLTLQAAEIKGIGIALPSIIDSESSKVISRYVKYNDAASFDFAAWSKKEWALPFVVENDARAALVGEWQYGAGKGCDDIVMITLGTGLGSAVLLNGQLLRGRNFIAGNLWGHTSVNLYGKKCNCGYTGCLETEASAWILTEKFESIAGHQQSSLYGKNISFSNVFSEAKKDDKVANLLVADCIRAWGFCAVNIVHAYDPQRIIFSGGVMEQSSIILPKIQVAIDKYAWLPVGTVKAVKADQPMYGSLLGLGYLLQNKITGEKI